MANIGNVWINRESRENGGMQVSIRLKPAGEVIKVVKLPESFFEAIMDIAQKAADEHEALMRAEILGDEYKINQPTEQ